MKLKNYFFIFLVTILVSRSINIIGQSPEWLWAKKYGSRYSICLDNKANIILSYSFTVINNYNIIEKYDSEGNFLWAVKGFGNGDNNLATDVTTDKSGNIYVTGYFNGDSLRIGTYVLKTKNPPFTADMFLAKLNADGDVLWATHAGGDCEAYINPFSISVDSEGNIYTCGIFQSNYIDFDNIRIYNSFPNCGAIYCDIFIAKYDSSGKAVWSKRAGQGTYMDYAWSVHVDKSDNVSLAGEFYSPSLDINDFSILKEGSGTAFVIKFDTDGKVLWGRTGKGSGVASCITSDSQKNCYIAGGFRSSTLIFEKDTLRKNENNNFFLVKYDIEGEAKWAKCANQSKNSAIYSIKTDSSGNVYVCGSYSGQPFVIDTAAIAGYMGIFIAKYDADGNFKWVKNVEGATNSSNSMAIDSSVNIYTIGWFGTEKIMFDTIGVTGAGTFLAKLSTSISTETKSIVKGFDFALYPNPANDRLFIDLGDVSGKAEVAIADIMGRIVYSSAVGQGDKSRVEIDTRRFPAGIYFIRFSDRNATAGAKFIIAR